MILNESINRNRLASMSESISNVLCEAFDVKKESVAIRVSKCSDRDYSLREYLKSRYSGLDDKYYDHWVSSILPDFEAIGVYFPEFKVFPDCGIDLIIEGKLIKAAFLLNDEKCRSADAVNELETVISKFPGVGNSEIESSVVIAGFSISAQKVNEMTEGSLIATGVPISRPLSFCIEENVLKCCLVDCSNEIGIVVIGDDMESNIELEPVGEMQVGEPILDRNYISKIAEVDAEVYIGSASVSLSDLLSLGKGSVISLNKSINDPVEIRISGKLAAKGTLVVEDESYGIRVIESFLGE